MVSSAIILSNILLASAVLSLNQGFKNVCPSLEDYSTINTNPRCSYNPDVGSSPRSIAKRYGYNFESHTIVTQDGYILALHRILPYNISRSVGADQRPPLLIVHGLAGSSAFWMLQGKMSLAFFLVDRGYDVWLGNLRGNYYSNNHVQWPNYSRKYWDFGLYEMAVYDLPACIDFISKKTGGRGNLTYIGHSMGTTISYIYSILRAKHAKENLRLIVSLAPVAYMKNVRGLFKFLAPLVPIIAGSLRLKGFHAIGQFYDLQRILLGTTCGKYPLINTCNLFLSLSTGQARNEFQPEMLPLFWSYYPSGTSLKTLEHFSQLIVNGGQFRMFDYGPILNIQKYNMSTPPEYDIRQLQVPVRLFVGSNDFLAPLEDSSLLEAKLIDNSRSEAKELKYVFPFAHNDFFLGKHLETFYRKLLEVISSKNKT